jgi:hypothetical protein
MEFKLDGKPVPHNTFPGLYPVYYITQDAGILCPKCVNDNLALCQDSNDSQWYVTHTFVNWESTDTVCDNCNCQLESAYGDNANICISVTDAESEYCELEECEYEFADGE